MPRAKILGFFAILIASILGGLFFYAVYFTEQAAQTNQITPCAHFALAAPLGLVSLFVIGTGFWIGLTILTIKVVPPMPEIVEKKDFSKIKAFLLCLITLFLGVLLVYGIYIQSYWALAVPATIISLILLGAIFWVGIAIITTRATLPGKKNE